MSDKEIIKELEIEVEELEFTISNSTKKLKKLKEILRKLNPLEYPESFESVDELEKWLNENNIEYIGVHIFDNDDWSYYDEQGFWHLYRDGVELTKGINTLSVHSFNNGDWAYRDKQGFLHLIRNGVELTKGIKAIDVDSWDDGSWDYVDVLDDLNEFDKDNNPII